MAAMEGCRETNYITSAAHAKTEHFARALNRTRDQSRGIYAAKSPKKEWARSSNQRRVASLNQSPQSANASNQQRVVIGDQFGVTIDC